MWLVRLLMGSEVSHGVEPLTIFAIVETAEEADVPHIIKTVVHLVRHGEPDGGERFRGRLDHPLNETGWAQMRAALDAFSGCDVVVSSPLKRCIEPAMEQAQRFAVPLWVDSRLREMSFGAWEGTTSDQIQARYG
uniref:histidine phosphatase family protein n=1 Tax=Sedimenticola sp. TaxID=1940285 RepID=UPI003D13E8DB